MPNAFALTSPAPPPEQAQQPQGGNALAGPAPGAPAPPGGGPQQQPQQTPAPGAQMTAAMLRHFLAIEKELTGLLKDPDCGKTDMRPKIIDGATKLVADGIMQPAEAVDQLGQVPDRPFDQKQWLEKNFVQTINSQIAALDHHRAAFAGAPDAPPGADPVDHSDMMRSAVAHYKGLNGNG